MSTSQLLWPWSVILPALEQPPCGCGSWDLIFRARGTFRLANQLKLCACCAADKNPASCNFQIPYRNIALSLAAFVAPLCAGCLFKYKYSEQANRIMSRFAKPYFLVLLVVAPSCVLITNTYYFTLVTWRHLVSGLLVGGMGYLAGATLPFICRQGKCHSSHAQGFYGSWLMSRLFCWGPHWHIACFSALQERGLYSFKYYRYIRLK